MYENSNQPAWPNKPDESDFRSLRFLEKPFPREDVRTLLEGLGLHNARDIETCAQQVSSKGLSSETLFQHKVRFDLKKFFSAFREPRSNSMTIELRELDHRVAQDPDAEPPEFRVALARARKIESRSRLFCLPSDCVDHELGRFERIAPLRMPAHEMYASSVGVVYVIEPGRSASSITPFWSENGFEIGLQHLASVGKMLGAERAKIDLRGVPQSEITRPSSLLTILLEELGTHLHIAKPERGGVTSLLLGLTSLVPIKDSQGHIFKLGVVCAQCPDLDFMSEQDRARFIQAAKHFEEVHHMQIERDEYGFVLATHLGFESPRLFKRVQS